MPARAEARFLLVRKRKLRRCGAIEPSSSSSRIRSSLSPSRRTPNSPPVPWPVRRGYVVRIKFEFDFSYFELGLRLRFALKPGFFRGVPAPETVLFQVHPVSCGCQACDAHELLVARQRDLPCSPRLERRKTGSHTYTIAICFSCKLVKAQSLTQGHRTVKENEKGERRAIIYLSRTSRASRGYPSSGRQLHVMRSLAYGRCQRSRQGRRVTAEAPRHAIGAGQRQAWPQADTQLGRKDNILEER